MGKPSRRDFLEISAALGLGTGLPKSAGGAGPGSANAAFDLRVVSQYRPAFATTYFGGFKGTTDRHTDGTNISTQVEGINDWSLDFQRIAYYLDPLMIHALFGFRYCPRFEWPDLVKNDPAEIAQWKQVVSGQLSRVFQTYRENGFQMWMTDGFFANGGSNTGPEWYEKVPDWSELTVDGKLPEVYTEDELGSKTRGIACLANPRLYSMQEGFAALRKELALDQEDVIIGLHPENEPGIEFGNFGGNPYTQKLFCEYLKRQDGDLEGFNRLLGTDYRSFDEVSMAHPSPYVRAWADRFRAWLVSDYYQGKLDQINRQSFPHWKICTRFQTYDFRGSMGDISYLGEITTDYAGISFYPNAYVNKEGHAVTNRMGMLSGLGSVLSAYGRPIALTEFGINKGVEPYAVLTEGFQPYEVVNLLYRALAYGVRMVGVFWYEHPSPGESWCNVYGMNLSRFPETLRAFQQVRDEMERIRPYETFGKPFPGALAILISRHALHYPGVGSLYYGALQKTLWETLDDPRLSQYDLIEEHAGGLEERLSAYRGVVVMDACLRRETRQMLERLAQRGIKTLVLGAPQYLDDRFRASEFPSAYPVAGMKGGDVSSNAGRKPSTAVATEHPVLGGRGHWVLNHASPVEGRPAALALLREAGSGEVLGYANDRVAYISGHPEGKEAWRDLLLGFAKWTGAGVLPVVVRHFQNAMVVQNYCPDAEDLKEQTLSEKGWIGRVSMLDPSWKGQLREARRDMPWLAYTRQGAHLRVEGLRLGSMEVQVVQKREGKELPHLEGTPEDMGYLEFALGWDHLVAKFEVLQEGEKVLRLETAGWSPTPAHWQINEVRSPQVVAQGSPPEVRFRAEPRKQYYLIVRQTVKCDPHCPLCCLGRMT